MIKPNLVCRTPDDTTLVVECRMPSPPERVYRAWTTASDLERWMCPEPGMKAQVRALDVRVGGEFEIALIGEEGPHVAKGRYLVLEPHHRIEMTWKWEPGEREYPETVLTIEVEPDGAGSLLRLTHAKLDTVESRDAHIGGWSEAVRCLAAWLGDEAVSAGGAR